MRQVYVFHNLKDEKTKNFFFEIFKASEARTVWGDYGVISAKDSLVKEAEKEIRDSDSLFILLDSGVMKDFQARQEFYWVSGYAKCRDVWILQNYTDLKGILVPFYEFKHHVVYCETAAWSEYLANAVRERLSLGTALPPKSSIKFEAVGGELNSYFDRITGQPLKDCFASKPVRFLTSCPRYKTAYTLHMPEDMNITRCPDCHDFFALKHVLQPGSVTLEA